MDRSVSIRFYEVVSNDGGLSLGDAIRDIAGIEDKVRRQRELAPGLHLRLEHYEVRNGLILGDLTRIQTENLPGQVTAEDLEGLPFGELGHSIAFCFDPEVNALAVQFHLQAQIKRVLEYLGEFAPNTVFTEFPLLDSASINDLVQKGIKRLTFRVSGIQDFRNSDVELGNFERNLAQMAT